MLSSGGWLRGMSFLISPWVLFAAAAVPKRPDIVIDECKRDLGCFGGFESKAK